MSFRHLESVTLNPLDIFRPISPKVPPSPEGPTNSQRLTATEMFDGHPGLPLLPSLAKLFILIAVMPPASGDHHHGTAEFEHRKNAMKTTSRSQSCVLKTTAVSFWEMGQHRQHVFDLFCPGESF